MSGHQLRFISPLKTLSEKEQELLISNLLAFIGEVQRDISTLSNAIDFLEFPFLAGESPFGMCVKWHLSDLGNRENVKIALGSILNRFAESSSQSAGSVMAEVKLIDLLNQVGVSGLSPLGHAVVEGHLEAIKFLMQKGAFLYDRRYSLENSALALAVKHVKVEVLNFFKQTPIQLSMDEWRKLFELIRLHLTDINHERTVLALAQLFLMNNPLAAFNDVARSIHNKKAASLVPLLKRPRLLESDVFSLLLDFDELMAYVGIKSTAYAEQLKAVWCRLFDLISPQNSDWNELWIETVQGKIKALEKSWYEKLEKWPLIKHLDSVKCLFFQEAFGQWAKGLELERTLQIKQFLGTVQVLDPHLLEEKSAESPSLECEEKMAPEPQVFRVSTVSAFRRHSYEPRYPAPDQDPALSKS
ncbi:MAG: ankyrin repeat domain-containing protein [Gammaproteobacteria bacterium]|nr:ankyrin repeat domain-containing protein [Gammaproteobacteria bacterium]